MRRQALVAAVVAVAVTAGYFVALLRPKLNDISKTQKQVEEARREEQTLTNRLRQLEEARRSAPATMAKLNALRLLLPATPDLPGFIRQVQAAADTAAVDLRSIQPSRPTDLEDAQGIQTITINLAVTGAFRRMEDFLVRLENLERVVEVRSISLAPGEQTVPGQVGLSGTLTLRLYVVREGARVGAAPAASPSPEEGS